MVKTKLYIILVLLVLSALGCIGAPSKTSPSPNNPPQEVASFLNEARGRCAGKVPWGEVKYLNMSILDERRAELEGKEYKYAVLGIRNVSFSGEVHFYGYDIIWERPENITTTGGQEIDFEIRREGKRIGAFRYFHIPFMLNSHCVAVESRQVKIADGKELTFVFIHSGAEDLWLVLSAS